MNITIDDIIARYNAEIAALTQRAVLAEAQRDAYKAQLDEQEEPSGD
ncbi:hypothetical protein [Brachybacterium sp. UMB0905]|nr:hypothetical protein [Brachybacterium sp. UMB0905]